MTTVDSAPPETTVPSRPAAAPQQRPRPVGTVRAPDVLALVGALAAAIGTTGIMWTQFSPFSGILGYVVVTWCLFVLYYAILVLFDGDRATAAAVLDALPKARVAHFATHGFFADPSGFSAPFARNIWTPIQIR